MSNISQQGITEDKGDYKKMRPYLYNYFFLGFIPCLEISEYICVFYVSVIFRICLRVPFLCFIFFLSFSAHVFVFVCHFSDSSKSCSVWRKERNQVIATNNFFFFLLKWLGFSVYYSSYIYSSDTLKENGIAQKIINKNKIHRG